MAFLAVLIMVAALRGLERIFPARDRAGTPLRTRLFARERLTDVAHIVFNEIVTKRIVKLAAIAVFFAFVIVFRLPYEDAGVHIVDVWHQQARITHLPILVQIPLALVTADLVGYWTHRALHAGWLWRLHAVHHSARALDWLAGARNHPLAEAFTTITMAGSLLVMGFDPRVLAVTAPLGLYAILLHANIRFGTSFMRYVVVTPLVHRWHHAHPDALPEHLRGGVNFAGLLPIWDILFGTFHAPKHQPVAFGADVPVPARFAGQLVFPFRSGYARSECVQNTLPSPLRSPQ